MQEVGPADFPEYGYAQIPGREVFITEAAFAKGRKQFLRPFDIAITIKGSVGKVAIFPPEIDAGESAGWVAGQSCLVLRVDDGGIIDPRVLFSFLKSEIGQAHPSLLDSDNLEVTQSLEKFEAVFKEVNRFLD